MINPFSSILVNWRIVAVSLVVILAGLLTPAFCQNNGIELLIQQSPALGGRITPSPGIHHFETNSEITLTASPEPGYQFSYWLGDVDNPRESSTTVYLNGSKIVVAVFELIQFELATENKYPSFSGGSGGGAKSNMIASVADYSRQGFSAGSAPASESKTRELSFETVVIPEPTTILLLVLGGAILRKYRGSNR